MNIPSVYRKAVDGFIIPPRSFFQMIASAARGAVSLVNEADRTEFINKLDKGTINEGVISQATAGPMMMLSLFHDLQNPLFQRYKFDAAEFLNGVGPALENFHNISGSLENELRKIRDESLEKVDESNEAIDEEGKTKGGTEAESDSKVKFDDDPVGKTMKAFQMVQGDATFTPEGHGEHVVAVMSHDWNAEAEKDPESLAGQLSKMLTTELFQIHQAGAKTAFLLQDENSRSIAFEEGSCTVNNVALLSARVFVCTEREDDEVPEGLSSPKYEMVDYLYELDDEEMDEKGAGVAAQVEVLYDVTQEFIAKAEDDSKKEEDAPEEESIQSTIVSVATLEGWLKGGPDGELRWRLALHRPAYEFPGIQQAY